jgi:tricorn protease
VSVRALLLAGAVAIAHAVEAQPPRDTPRLLRNPSLGADRIAFLFADEIWSVPRAGGSATQLTRGGTARGGPVFSPDGRWIAYAASTGASTDLFVLPADGGEPRRITWHPASENVVAWSPDGQEVVFSSSRTSGLRGWLGLFRARADGAGVPEPVPLPTGSALSFSPDGRRVAYVPISSYRGWKGYRGGRAPYIWLADLKTLDVVRVPHTTASDWSPMWVGGRVYFLSDRAGPATLFEYDVASGTVRPSVENGGFDFVSASSGAGGIVVDAFDSIKLFDPATRVLRTVPVTIDSSFGALAARDLRLPGRRAVRQALSPTGRAFAAEARGEVFVVPVDSGAPARNLTRSTGVAERWPFWSPDGARVGYVSDSSGEYRLVIRAVDDTGTSRSVALGEGRGVFGGFRWSPSGRHVAYADERHAMWVLDVATGRSVRVGSDPRSASGLAPGDWSPDGRWLAFTRTLPNRMRAAFLYSVETGATVQVTDGRTDVSDPTFDRGGHYLYFLASADRPMSSTGSMAAFHHPVTTNAYAALLSSRALPPDSARAADTDATTRVDTRVDTAGLRQRVVRLPAPTRSYGAITAGAPGVVFLLDGNALGAGPPVPGAARRSVWRVGWARHAAEEVLRDVDHFELSGDGSTALARRGETTSLVPAGELRPVAGAPSAPNALPGRAFALPPLPLAADPRADWAQIFRETWRLARDLFYADDYNGLDLAAAEARYAPFLAGLGSRGDLSYLVREMLTNLSVSHLGTGDPPADGDDAAPAPRGGPGAGAQRLPGAAGLLGADYELRDGRYRITRIYRGDPWLDATGPLAAPGVDVRDGDFLIAVNGTELRAEGNVDRALDGTAGRRVELRVASDPTGAGARTVTVTPTADEFPLRHAAWIEANRRRVDSLSGGRLAYVYVINTGNEGYEGFNRQYLAQVDRSGLIVDERNNGGGQLADYMIDRLRRVPLAQMWPRYGDSHPFPTDLIAGPSAMIVNELAGSGGDILPYLYRKARLGPIVGKRTWGGTVGSGAVPQLIDGGTVNVPHFPISDPDGSWEGLEGSGVTPDVVVEMDPKSVAAGRDPQLEAAVRLVLARLKASPPKAPKRPPARGRPSPAGRAS